MDQRGPCHSEPSEESHQIKKLQILHSVQDDKNGTFYETINIGGEEIFISREEEMDSWKIRKRDW